MKSPRQVGLVLCAFLFAWLAVPAQAQYRFSSWTVDNGLPQNSINDLRQTRDGYLWLTTFDGLVRFDGVLFTVFNKANTPGISSNRFLRLYEDAQGDLWAGSEDGGLVRYHQGRFTSYGKEQGLTSLYAAYLTEDADGELLVFLVNDKIMRLSEGRFLPFMPVDSPVRDRLTKHREAYRVPCPYGPGKVSCLGYGTSWTEADGLPSANVSSADGVEDRNGVLWLALADGLARIENRKVVKVYTDHNGLPGSPVSFVTGATFGLLSKDKSGALWMTDIETMRSQLVSSNPFAPLTTIGSARAYQDREGNLWFATTRNGLVRARRQFITGYSVADGLAENNIYPIFEAHDGVVWIGTTKGIFQYKDGRFSLDEVVKTGGVTAIAEDSAGRLVIALSGQVWLREGGRFHKIMDRPTGLIWSIYPAADGSLWLGWELGLIHLKDGAETVYTTNEGLAGNDVKVIIDDGAGGLWIGAYGGLTHYLNGRFTSWTERDGLPSRTVRGLYRDRDGVLWIGTYDGGLGRFKDGKFTRYATSEGLSGTGAFQILEDGRGNLWISSNHGIYRVNKQELNEFADGKRKSVTSVVYGKADGMLNVECNGGRSPAGFKASNGKLWFPTQDGVAVIDPDAVPVNPQPPPVMIESFLLDRAPVALDGEVRIQPNQENFEIRYTALSYISSEDLRFKYQLEGLDRDWVDAGTRRTAYYSHLRPGSYTFKVIAANRDGVWNLQGAAIRFKVLPRFYQTWWFPTLLALGILGLGFAVYRIRVNRLELARKTQEEFSRKLLQSQEYERQRIAAELHDSLGQSLLIIKNRVALAQKDIDEKENVEEQLGELSHSATSAIEECREIAYNLRPFQLDRFGLTKTLAGIFMRIGEVTNMRATSEIDPIDELLTNEAQVNVYRVVQECVNNIIKHSQATEARLIVKSNRREISLLVEDNGRGFAKESHSSVSSADSSLEPVNPAGLASGSRTNRNGFGLIGIAERVKMLHGHCEIDSEHGTSIRIRIPVDK